jgi:hypothetical protein
VLLVPTLLTSPPPYALLDQPRGTTRAFFDVEFATENRTEYPMHDLTGLQGRTGSETRGPEPPILTGAQSQR